MKKIILFVLLLMIFEIDGYSQTNDSIKEKKRPVLYGHAFPSVGYFESSFINTSLKANIGIGETPKLKIPGFIIDDIEILSFEGQILFVDFNIEYQQRFTPWLSLYISANMTGRIGTDMSTILADGVNTLSGGTIGWLVRIKQSEKLNFSGTIAAKKINGTFINVADYIRDILNNNPNPTVFKKIPATLLGIGFRGAYAFNPTFGLQFFVDFNYGESLQRSNAQLYFSGGFIGDVDFKPRFNVPIGVAIGYTLTTTPAIVMNEQGNSNLFSTKISYTGSDDFEIGLQYTSYNINLSSIEGKPYIKKVLLSFQFYF